MAVFDYKAMDHAGGLTKGYVTADTPSAAREMLRDRGWRVRSIRSARASGRVKQQSDHASTMPIGRFGRHYHHDARVVGLVRELSTLLGVGVSLPEALTSVARQHRGWMQSLVMSLHDAITSGSSLAEAMRRHPHVFDELSVSMVDVGENAGNLDEVLCGLADFKQRWQRLKSGLATALLYPCFVLVVGVLVSVFLMTYVVPNLLESLLESGQALPWSTRVVKGASDLLLGYWWALLPGLVVMVMGITYGLRTARGRAWSDRMQLRLPLVGDLTRKQAMVRIAVVMATLLRSGVSFIRAVSIARTVTRNTVLKDALQRVETAVTSGRDIGQALEQTEAFPPTVVQIFAVGQASGKLEEMLDRLARDYDEQVQMMATRLTTILEPVLILLLALVVGLIAAATVMPILEAGNLL